LKILSGEWRGRALHVPGALRPTTALTRKIVFDILAPAVQGSVFHDFFAGSGLMAFEALSRGAEFARVYEFDKKLVEALHKNSKKLGATARLMIHSVDLAKGREIELAFGGSHSIIFFDPPYDLDLAGFPLFLKMKAAKKDEDILVCESRNPLDGATRVREVGDHTLSFFY